MQAGVKDEGVLFLFTDGQITNEKFLVFINDLLASGEFRCCQGWQDHCGREPLIIGIHISSNRRKLERRTIINQ